MDPVAGTRTLYSSAFARDGAAAAPLPAVAAAAGGPRAVTGVAAGENDTAVARQRQETERNRVDLGNRKRDTDGALRPVEFSQPRYRSQLTYEADLRRIVLRVVDRETEETLISLPPEQALRHLRDAAKLARAHGEPPARFSTSV